MRDEGFSPRRSRTPRDENILPREGYTQRRLLGQDDDSEPREKDTGEFLPRSDERTMAVLCHVGGAFTSFLLPLVFWLSNKGRSPLVDDHSKEALNFQLFQIVLFGIMTVVGCGVLFVALTVGMSSSAGWTWGIAAGVVVGALTLYEIVFVVIGSIAAWKGRSFHYPCIIRFIK